MNAHVSSQQTYFSIYTLGQASALQTAVNKYMFPLDSLINIFDFFLTILGVKARTLYTLCKHRAMEQHP